MGFLTYWRRFPRPATVLFRVSFHTALVTYWLRLKESNLPDEQINSLLTHLVSEPEYIGSRGGARTPDKVINSHRLYLLSYPGIYWYLGPDSNRHSITTEGFSYHYSFRYHLKCLWSGLYLHHSFHFRCLPSSLYTFLFLGLARY